MLRMFVTETEFVRQLHYLLPPELRNRIKYYLVVKLVSLD
jgi:hypothetical protein